MILRRDLLKVGAASLALPLGSIAKGLEGAVTQPSQPRSSSPIYFNYDGKVFVINATQEFRDDLRACHGYEVEQLVKTWTAHNGRYCNIFLERLDPLKEAAPKLVPIEARISIWRWGKTRMFHYALVPTNRIVDPEFFRTVRSIIL